MEKPDLLIYIQKLHITIDQLKDRKDSGKSLVNDSNPYTVVINYILNFLTFFIAETASRVIR